MADRTRTFMDEIVLPLEREWPSGDAVPAAVIEELQAAAREYDVFAPHAPTAYGGQGLSMRAALPVFETAGQSLLGPPALRINSPDQANITLLAELGTTAQQDRWLTPLVQADVDSAFAMTEPLPGSGSDPGMMQTTATKQGDEWVLNGHKWWTTQGAQADLLFVMARTAPDATPPAGFSLFLVPADTPGVTVVREIPNTTPALAGRHAELVFEEVRVPETALLGEAGSGLDHAQLRTPASRFGRCMRQLGMAMRAQDIAVAYAATRKTTAGRVADKQTVRFELASVASRLHAARCLLRWTVAQHAAGAETAGLSRQMCQLVVGNVVEDVVSTAVTLCGANGVGKDLPLADFYEYVRPTSSTLTDVRAKQAIATALFEDAASDELEPVVRFGSRSRS